MSLQLHETSGRALTTIAQEFRSANFVPESINLWETRCHIDLRAVGLPSDWFRYYWIGYPIQYPIPLKWFLLYMKIDGDRHPFSQELILPRSVNCKEMTNSTCEISLHSSIWMHVRILVEGKTKKPSLDIISKKSWQYSLCDYLVQP